MVVTGGEFPENQVALTASLQLEGKVRELTINVKEECEKYYQQLKFGTLRNQEIPAKVIAIISAFLQ